MLRIALGALFVLYSTPFGECSLLVECFCVLNCCEIQIVQCDVMIYNNDCGVNRLTFKFSPIFRANFGDFKSG